MQPRPYQRECLDAIDVSMMRFDRVLVCLPTGTGKTNIFSWLIHSWRDCGRISPGRPAIVLAHREELLSQAMNRLQVLDPDCRIGLERSDSSAPYSSEVVVASIQTVGKKDCKRLAVLPSLVIVDEAHHVVARTYQNALERWGAFDGGCKVLGCTATPKRLDRKGLHNVKGAVFEDIAYTYTLRDAIEDRWLCPLRGYRVVTKIDLDKVGTVGGDFNQGQLGAAVDDAARTQAAYNRWREVASERKTLVFCVNVEHAKHAAGCWEREGFRAEYVHGGIPPAERAQIMQRFRSGRTQVLTNCEIATEGFDVPDIASVVMLRPTKSWALYVQMAGRGTRICDGKEDCIILDVVDNTTKHDLASVPSILDLPAKFNLEGRTLGEAAKKIEDLGARGGVLLKNAQPTSFAEIDSLMERVDLFCRVETPPGIREYSKLAWLETSDGGYYLSAGKGREVRLVQDALGNWSFHVFVPGDSRMWDSRKDDLKSVIKSVDPYVLNLWPDASAILMAGGKWREQAPTPKQLQLLAKLGVNVGQLTGLNKDRASGLITQLIEEERRAG